MKYVNDLITKLNSLEIGFKQAPILIGGATVWDDLRFPAVGINPIGAPTAANYIDTELAYSFSATADNWVGIVAQMPHSWKLGSTIYPHLHIITQSTNAGTMLWKVQYKWTNIGAVEAVNWTDAVDTIIAASGVDKQHQLISLPPIDGTGKTLSSILRFKVGRIGTDNTYDTHTAATYLTEIDIHYEMDSLGSKEEFSK